MSKPQPILEFYSVGSHDRGETAHPKPSLSSSPTDLRWSRVEEFFSAKTFAAKTRRGYV